MKSLGVDNQKSGLLLPVFIGIFGRFGVVLGFEGLLEPLLERRFLFIGIGVLTVVIIQLLPDLPFVHKTADGQLLDDGNDIGHKIIVRQAR